MFKPIFEVMNEMLDEIILAYPTAVGVEKEAFQEKLSVLKMMSDTFIEEWLKFEEKMGVIHQNGCEWNSQAFVHSKVYKEAYDKAQGYYKLKMFEEAVQQFKQVIHEKPEFYMARLYLALCYLQMGHHEEAYNHIHLFEKAYEADPLITYYSLS